MNTWKELSLRMVSIARESIYNPGSRVRDVEVGPQGKIYVALEDPGRIVVLTPAD